MGIYIGLIIFILLLSPILNKISTNKEKTQRIILFLGMFAIFLLLALKGTNVGVDILAYKEQYEISKYKSWSNVEYVYFESGYITLTKIFSKAGISFQGFLAFVYGTVCFSMYRFIKKYSTNFVFSMIIFICYDFFVLSISGIRQMLAMSICLIAYISFDKKTFLSRIWGVFLVYIASTIHQSAIVFYIIFPLFLIKSDKINFVSYPFLIILSIFIRPYMWEFINDNMRTLDLSTQITLGGNFIFLFIIAIFMYVVNIKNNIFNINFLYNQSAESDITTIQFTKTSFLSLILHIIFSGHSMTRAAMYVMMFLIPGLPRTINKLDSKTKLLAETFFIIFFICLFYFETLLPNKLGLLPYKFFWQ